MQSFHKIRASSLTEALSLARKNLGENAVIVKTEQQENDVVLTATSTTATSFSPYLRNQHASEDLYDTVLKAIRVVCTLCDDHQMNAQFCEAWLDQLKTTPVRLSTCLKKVISFNPSWLTTITPLRPIILVGPPGSGKTTALIKLAAMFLSRKETIRVLTLDSFRAGAVEQLKEAMKVLDQTVEIGYEALEGFRNQKSCYLLVDTPGLNLNYKQDQEFLALLREKFTTPFTLVLSADMNPIDAQETTKNFSRFSIDSLLGTRLDFAKCYGGLLQSCFEAKLPWVLGNLNPSLAEPLWAVEPEKLINYLFHPLSKHRSS